MKHIGYHLLAIFTIAIWGVTFVNTKVLLQYGLQPMEIFLLRFIVAYLCIWTISPRRLLSESWQDEGLFFILGLVGGTIYFVTENTALGLTYVNNVSFIVCTAPLMTMLLAILFVKSIKATVPLVLGSLIALLGVALVIYNGHFVLKLNPLGDFLALMAAFCWAIYSLVIKKVSRRYSATFITRKVFFYGLVSMIPYLVCYPGLGLDLLVQQPALVWNLLFLGCVASMLCFLAWNWVIKKLGAVVATNYVYLNPVTTIVFAWLVLHEQITFYFILGTLLILVGMYLADKRSA
jgi:drug/metabolite transporter (DMT)-like permease